MNKFGKINMQTVRKALKNERFPYAHFAKVIADKSRGTITRDEAAQMSVRLLDKSLDLATQTVAQEILKRIKP